jgi:hypothetical protein
VDSVKIPGVPVTIEGAEGAGAGNQLVERIGLGEIVDEENHEGKEVDERDLRDFR